MYYTLSSLFMSFEIQPKVAVFMWYDSKISSFADINYKINKAYCDKHNIEIICCNQRRYTDRHPVWERIPLILEHINKYDYAIWIDADAHFYIDSEGFTEPLENRRFSVQAAQNLDSLSRIPVGNPTTNENIVDVIAKYSNYNFIFSNDIPKSIKEGILVGINTGFFIVKNTKYSVDFLHKWGYDELLYKNNRFPKWGDQGVVLDMYKENILDIQNNSIVLDYGVLQHFHDDDVFTFDIGFSSKILDVESRKRSDPLWSEKRSFSSGSTRFTPKKPFVFHLAGRTETIRYNHSLQYFTEMGSTLFTA